MSLKVCFFVRNISMPSGIERVTSAIANRLAEYGYDVSIMSLWGGLEPFYEKHENVSLYQLFANQAHGEKELLPPIFKQLVRFPLASIRLRRFLQQYPQDILIDTDYLLGQVALPAVLGLQLKHVHWEHFNFKLDANRPIKKFGRRMVAYLTHGLVTLTERDLVSWQEGAKIKGPMKSIPNPMPFKLPKVEYDADNRTILAVGRLNEQKGFDLLLQAWAIVAKEAASRGWKLRIVGSGEEKDSLESLRDSLGIKDSTELVPTTQNVDMYYRDASIYCLSSRYEGFPMVLLEAQAYCLPTVAFDCDTGPAEIVCDKETGYLIENGNIEAFAKGLMKLMSSQEDRERFSKQSATAAQRFQLEPIAQQWAQFLEQVQAAKAPKAAKTTS